MASTRSLFFEPEPARGGADPARDLVGGGDDYAVTVASRLDRRFWVRVERRPVEDALVVTDYAAGARPQVELEAALAIALRAIVPTGPHALAFRDLVPAGDQAPLYPARIVQAADLVKRLAAGVADSLATAVASFEMRPCRGKIDARVTFAASRPA